jgi:lipoprotein-anchoring transpeptidase ErfK/SrfK
VEESADGVSITQIRAGIGTNLRTLAGLRVAETIPDSFSPPIAVVSLQSVQYNGAFNTKTVQGLTTYNFVVSVIVGKVAERVAQNRLDSYISTGTATVKAAIESDRTLGGAAFDCVVPEMTNVGTVLLSGDVSYLAADFTVTVYAN